MSGEQDRKTPPQGARAIAASANKARPAAGGNPFLDDGSAPPAASSRAKKPKPPPGIMSAGGMDMARAHAENILPKKNLPEQPSDMPRVVVTVETDPRRMPTNPKLIEGKGDSTRPPPDEVAAKASGASPWATTAAPELLDKRSLPSANLAIPAEKAPPASAPAQRKQEPMPIWLRAAVVIVLLLLVAGVVKRLRLGRPDDSSNPTRTVATAPPLPDEATANPTATAAPARDLAARAPAPPTETADPSASADVPIDPSADPSASAAPHPPRLAPPPPRPTYKPLFELPQEKSKE